jgi:predicted component of type VI protein secretion system
VRSDIGLQQESRGGSEPVRQLTWPRRQRGASQREAALLPQRQGWLEAARQPRSSPVPSQPRSPRLVWKTTALVAARHALLWLPAAEQRGSGRLQCSSALAEPSGTVPRCKLQRRACAVEGTRKSAFRARGRSRTSYLRTERLARHRRKHALRCSSCDSIAR